MAIEPPAGFAGARMWHIGGDGWYMNPPTIAAASVGLPPNTIYIDPNSGKIYRTV